MFLYNANSKGKKSKLLYSNANLIAIVHVFTKKKKNNHLAR